MKEGQKQGSSPLEIVLLCIWVFTSITAITIYLSVKYFNLKVLKKDGVETYAVITEFQESSMRGAPCAYVYNFCIANEIFRQTTECDHIKYKRFIYGDKITVKYLPSNPKINKPMYLLYKKDPEIRKKYEKEFLKKLNREEPVNEYWNGWNDVLNYQHRFPLHSEYPCLPPWY